MKKETTCPCCGQVCAVSVPGAEVVELLGGQQRVVFERLLTASGRMVPRRMLLDEMYGDDPDGGALSAEKVLHLVVHRLRKAVAPHGYRIENAWGRGYRLKVAA